MKKLFGILALVLAALAAYQVVSCDGRERVGRTTDRAYQSLSNLVENVKARLATVEKAAVQAEGNLAVCNHELVTTSNSLVQTESRLVIFQRNTAADKAKAEAQIRRLEADKAAQLEKVHGLEANLADLKRNIATTEAKLKTSESNRAQTLAELARLRKDKTELETRVQEMTARLAENSAQLLALRSAPPGSAQPGSTQSAASKSFLIYPNQKGAEKLLASAKPARKH